MATRKFALAPTNYARRMDLLSRKIFGERPRGLDWKSNNIVDRLERIPVDHLNYRYSYDWYCFKLPMLFNMAKLLRMHGLFRDEHLDWNDEMERQRVARGKIKNRLPGSGKRAKLRNEGL